MKKVSFVITDMSSGGAERVMSIVANYFVKHDILVDIIAIRSDKIDYKLESKINFKYIGGKDKNIFYRFFYRLRKIKKETKNSDVIISFLWHCNIYTLLSNMFTKKKIIISERSNPAQEMLGGYKFFKWLRNLIYLRANKIVFQTTDAMNYYKGKLKKKGIVIPNPITPNLPMCSRKKQNKIVAVGRLTEQKNYPLMLNSFKNVVKEFPNYKLLIYGDGDLKLNILNWIKNNNLEKSIILKGFCDNVISELLDAKLFLNSSNFEGISNSMLEALGVGLPVVVTDCPVGGAKQFVNSGFNGELVTMNDEKQFSNAIIKILRDDNYRETLSKNSLKINELLSVDNIGKKWIELL